MMVGAEGVEPSFHRLKAERVDTINTTLPFDM